MPETIEITTTVSPAIQAARRRDREKFRHLLRLTTDFKNDPEFETADAKAIYENYKRCIESTCVAVNSIVHTELI